MFNNKKQGSMIGYVFLIIVIIIMLAVILYMASMKNTNENNEVREENKTDEIHNNEENVINKDNSIQDENIVVDNSVDGTSEKVENSEQTVEKEYQEYVFINAYGEVKIKCDKALQCRGTAGASNKIFYIKDNSLYLYNHNEDDELYANSVEDIYYEADKSEIITVKILNNSEIIKENTYLNYINE